MLDPGPSPERSVHPETPVSPEMSVPEDPSARRRHGERKTARDMVLSVLAVLGVAMVIFLAVPRPSTVPRRAVDVDTAAAGARAGSTFQPAVPRGLPVGWTATSAGVRDSGDGIRTWHIGYLTAGGHYASVEQAAGATGRWEEILTSGGTPREPQVIEGTRWEQRFKDVRDVHALIHRGDGWTIMVTSKGGGLGDAVVLARSLPVTRR